MVQVQDETGKTIGNGEIRFGSDGSPATGFNTAACEERHSRAWSRGAT
jgi:hypothetical protein